MASNVVYLKIEELMGTFVSCLASHQTPENIEMYTNKELLIQKFEEARLSPEASKVEFAKDICSAARHPSNFSPLVSIQLEEKHLVYIETLMKFADQVLIGKIFLGRVIVPPIQMSAIQLLVEDPKGQRAVRLSIYNYHEPITAFPVGTIVGIINPYFKTAFDGGLCVIAKDNDCQIKIHTRDFGIQYDINDVSSEVKSVPDLQKIKIESEENVSQDIYSSASESEHQFLDGSYDRAKIRDDCQKNYSESDESESEDNEEEFPSNDTPHQEDKYIIFASKLLLLFKICQICHKKPVKNITRKVFGTGLRITTECLDGCRYSWESQPKFNTTWWGNYLLAASLYYSEVLPTKCVSALKHFKLKMFSMSVYFKLQRWFHPIIEKVYLDEQEKLLKASLSEPVVICGDGRADSLDYSGKCGLYTCIEGKSQKILHVELVQSSEVTNLNQMEIEGLKRGLNFLKSFGIVVSKLVTDKQSSIVAYVRDYLPDIIHELDIWHVCKNIKSKLTPIAKKKGNETLNAWIREIINHVYWIANNSISKAERLDKWTSITNHMCNIHEGHSKTYQKCSHNEISPDETRVWIERDSELYWSISKVVNSSGTLTGIANLSTDYKTYSFEVFHSILSSFCTKRVHFDKDSDSFKSRVYLAVMHFNENGHKQPVINEHGEEVYFLSYPKAKDSASTTKKILKETTFEYVENLMEATYQNANPENCDEKFSS